MKVCKIFTFIDFFREIVMFQFISGLKYKLRLEFPAGYPYTAPTVRFVTPCFHPNVDQHGNICLDILKEKWSALYEVRTILLSIQSLLGKCIFTQCGNSNFYPPLRFSVKSTVWKNGKLILIEKIFREINSGTSFFNKNVDFTEFLVKTCESKIP